MLVMAMDAHRWSRALAHVPCTIRKRLVVRTRVVVRNDASHMVLQ